MPLISVEHNPSPAKLEAMQVDSWPIWTKEVSRFDWTYDEAETCYILTGEVIVTPQGGEPVTLRARDLVHFAAGLACTWDVRAPVEKHYRLG